MWPLSKIAAVVACLYVLVVAGLLFARYIDIRERVLLEYMSVQQEYKLCTHVERGSSLPRPPKFMDLCQSQGVYLQTGVTMRSVNLLLGEFRSCGFHSCSDLAAHVVSHWSILFLLTVIIVMSIWCCSWEFVMKREKRRNAEMLPFMRTTPDILSIQELPVNTHPTGAHLYQRGGSGVLRPRYPELPPSTIEQWTDTVH